jgi:hypothetical protein
MLGYKLASAQLAPSTAPVADKIELLKMCCELAQTEYAG